MKETHIEPDSVVPIPPRDRWSHELARIAEQPLECCEEFPRIARRFEAWWAGEVLDRPVFMAAANADPSRPITRRLELLDRPDDWFAAKRADLQQTHYVGDAVPHIRVDFGPVLLAGFFGGRREYGSDTAWTRPLIRDDWSNEPDWTLAEDNPWWLLLQKLMRLTAEDAAGRYLVCTPDLGSSADLLLNLRGATQLCMDVLERPHRVQRAVEAVYPVWQRAFTELYRATVEERGAGLIHWFGVWSNRPYHCPACDFNFMIGPEEFNRLCLPDIARQSASAGRACFHLDGPGAARHINALLETPEIQAIQFTPGASAPSALAWVEMFRKIQQHGRSLLVFCPAEEVLALCDQLSPEGLAILIESPPPVQQLDEVYRALCAKYGVARA